MSQNTTTNKCMASKAIFIILAVCAFAMLIVSFFLPPTGQIHPSVLQGTAIMLGFAALTYVPDFIHGGTDIHIRKGDIDISMENPDPGK